jgi:hypothetical protein
LIADSLKADLQNDRRALSPAIFFGAGVPPKPQKDP